MPYYIIGYLKNGYAFYLSHIMPPLNQQWTANLGIQLATKFTTEEQAKVALTSYLNGRIVSSIFIHTVVHIPKL